MRNRLLCGAALVVAALVFAGLVSARDQSSGSTNRLVAEGGVYLPAKVGSASSGKVKFVTTKESFPMGKGTIEISEVADMWPSVDDNSLNVLEPEFSPFSQDAVYCFAGCAKFNNGDHSDTPRLSPLISYHLPGGGWDQYGHLGPGKWLPYVNAHRYVFPVTLTATGPISFAFQDTKPDDNEGGFSIRVTVNIPKAEEATPLLRLKTQKSLSIVVYGKEPRPSRAKIASGGRVKFCNNDPFYALPFGKNAYDSFNLPPGGLPRRGVHRLASGKCVTFVLHNPGKTDVLFKVFDTLHSRFKLVITVAPHKR